MREFPERPSYKNFSFMAGKSIQFRGGFYNFFNHPQYASGSISTVGGDFDEHAIAQLLESGTPALQQGD